GLAALHELRVDRHERELEAVRDAELVENVRNVVLDGVFADGELTRDVLVGQSAYDGGDDLLLARREAKPPLRVGRRLPANVVQQVSDRVAIDPGLPRHHRA